MIMALLTAVPVLLHWTGHHGPSAPGVLLLVFAMLAVGIPGLVLGVQHVFALRHAARITATPPRKLKGSVHRKSRSAQ